MANALSRRWEHEKAEIAAITIVTPTWLDDIRRNYFEDVETKGLINWLSRARQQIHITQLKGDS